MKRFLDYVLVVICMLCMAGCQNEDVPEEVTEPATEPGLYLCLNTVGSGNGFSTRAIADDESKVKNLYVVYFKGPTGGSDAAFTFVEQGKVSSTVLDFSTSQVFKLYPTTAKESYLSVGETWKVVFLANVSESLTISSGTTLYQLKTSLQVGVSNVVWQGATLTATGNAYIPMYYCTGEVELPDTPYRQVFYINETDNTAPKPHSLIRMMAKFTVTNNIVTDFTGKEDLYSFFIENIYVVNGNTTGLVGCNNWNATQKRVTAPTIPSVVATATSPAIAGGAWTGDKQVITFYLLECSVKNTGKENETNCYIKLEGKRTSSASVTDSYNSNYMLPIYDTQYSDVTETTTVDMSKAGPVLRNHYYNYTITGVHRYALQVTLNVAPWIPVNIIADPIPLP